ncbi:MAG: dockerin type I repeat-containing protein [Clostridia bacterium]|nr:dockerin type I repeat-containing protein [Clostridia bacterium]
MKLSRKIIAIVMSVVMLMSAALPVAMADDSEATNIYYSDSYKITKITNPTTGSGEADGLLYGEDANRINSYAWSTAYRDGYLYIGVNRNFLNVALSTFGTGLSTESINAIEAIFTRGELPAFNKDERQAMIIKLNPETAETEIIYQPPYLEQYDVYLDAAYRNVIEYKGDLYYGTMGAVTTRILKVDKDDNVTVAFSGGAGASFRSSAIYNDELFFAGFDTRITDNVKEDGSEYTKMAIIRMEGEEWNRVADYKDFIDYAEDTIYKGEGGNMWDIVSYNGYLYSIIATSNGFVMFKGYEDPTNENANEYGWVWTEVIGKNSEYHPGMAEAEEGYPLNGAVASSATPVVYNGKLYLGTFDYATQALSAFIRKIVPLVEGEATGVTLSDLLTPMYNSLTHPQKLYEVDENDNITEGTEFNKLMEGTANEYIWRFQEYNGKLYIGTFDAETMYKYITQITDGFLASIDMNDVVDMIDDLSLLIAAIKDNDAQEAVADLEEAVESGEAEDIAEALENADETIDNLEDSEEAEEASSILDTVMDVFDMEGLSMYMEMGEYMVNNVAGADLYVTEDMETFECITINGFNDEYNYGFRTFAATDDGLYIGTANPFYGAQVWRLNDLEDGDIIGNDVDYSLNMTKKLVSPAYAGTKVCTVVDALEVDNFLDTSIVDENGYVLGRQETFRTGDILRSTTTIMFTERTVLEYTLVVLGDTNCDGDVTATDARIALRIAAGLETATDAVISAADATFDSKITAADARAILRASANLEPLTI